MTLTISEIAELSRNVMNEVSRAVVGKQAGLENIMTALLVPGGHLVDVLVLLPS